MWNKGRIIAAVLVSGAFGAVTMGGYCKEREDGGRRAQLGKLVDALRVTKDTRRAWDAAGLHMDANHTLLRRLEMARERLLSKMEQGAVVYVGDVGAELERTRQSDVTSVLELQGRMFIGYMEEVSSLMRMPAREIQSLLPEDRDEGSPENKETVAKELLVALHMAQLEFSGRRVVDCDQDGNGEFASGPELVGAWGVRRSFRSSGGKGESGFWEVGGWHSSDVRFASPLIRTNANGTLESWGYVYQVFLPSSSEGGGWQGFIPKGGELQGRSGAIDVDASERWWCAYAIPRRFGIDGKAVYCVDAGGLVVRYDNAEGRISGQEWVDGFMAFESKSVGAELATKGLGVGGYRWSIVN